MMSVALIDGRALACWAHDFLPSAGAAGLHLR
jgi:hypothetical protein